MIREPFHLSYGFSNNIVIPLSTVLLLLLHFDDVRKRQDVLLAASCIINLLFSCIHVKSQQEPEQQSWRPPTLTENVGIAAILKYWSARMQSSNDGI